MYNPIAYFSFALIVFLGVLACCELGQRIGAREIHHDPENAKEGVAAVEAAILALLGLLIAFTFDGAADRFQDRRRLIIAETTALSTAVDRFNLLDEPTAGTMRTLMAEYIDTRLATYPILSRGQDFTPQRIQAESLQDRMWSMAVSAVSAPGVSPAIGMLMLPALNSAFDTSTERMLATRLHPPMVVFALLLTLSLVSATLAGFGMAGGRGRKRLHKLAFAAVLATTVLLTLDLEYPRRGFIRVDSFDVALREFRATLD
jgi:hypothetical protein